jgi:Flp pilus assembly protein TadD
MSTYKTRRPPPRGNTQRRSNVSGLPPYAETLRPGPEGVPPEATTAPPPAVVMNGSALPKAAAVVVGAPSANDGGDDSPPDSSTRSKEGSPEPKPVVESASQAPERSGSGGEPPGDPAPEEVVSKAKTLPKTDVEEDRKARTGRGERAERRGRERGKGARGRSSSLTPTPPPAEVSPGVTGAAETSTKSLEADKVEASAPAAAPADLDDRFFAEGVQSEREAFSRKSHGAPAQEEEEIDPKILLKMHPVVRARREKNMSYVKWAVLAAVIIGLGGFMKHRMSQQGDQEAAAAEVEEYKKTHPPGSRTDNPPAEPAATQAPAAVQAAAAPAEPPPPAAATAPAEPAVTPGAPGAPAVADGMQANAGGPIGKAAAAETKPGEATVASASAPPAAAEAPLAPAKTAAQEKRDCQVFLDRGSNGAAIAAGQRSVSLDASDGEAWLLLGAALQVTGRNGEAKRAYSSCVKQGTHGPIGDCKTALASIP